MRLASLTRPELIFTGLPATDRAAVLRAFADRIAAQGLVRDAGELYGKLLEREQLGSTGVGSGVAIPHCKLKGLSRGIVAIGKTEREVDFQAVDGKPVELFFVVVSPSEAPAEHLQVLAAISRWLKADRNAERVRTLADRDAIYDLLRGGAS